MHRDAFAMRRETLEANHPTMALSLRHLAQIEVSLGNPNEARVLLDEAMSIATAVYEGKPHPRVAEILHAFSELAILEEDLAQSIDYSRRAVAMLKDRLGDDNRRTAEARVWLAKQLIDSKQTQEASEELEKAIAGYTGIVRNDDERLIEARTLRARLAASRR